MSFTYPVLHYPGFLLKDLGQRMVLFAHEITKRRRFYPYLRHQNIRVYKTIKPLTEDAAFVAPSANLVGNVIFGAGASAMYHVSIRNYHSNDPTRVGDGTSLLENVSFMGSCVVGSNCVIGVGSTLDCCTVHDNVIVGSHVNIALGCRIESGAIIATGSTVAQDTRVPANELWAGNPAVKISDVTEQQRDQANNLVRKHQYLAKQHSVAVHDHIAEAHHYDANWLIEMCAKIEAHQQKVTFPEDIPLPIEAKRFLQPRVHARLPHIHPRVTYPINRIAPHMNRHPDWTGNA